MQRAFSLAMQWQPCSADNPWHLVVTFDEFTPGNALQPVNHRKSMVVNFSFMEMACFGDLAWWTMAVVRRDNICRVEGGWSRMLRDLLRIALGPPNGMQVAGIPVILGGEHTMIFANLACLLSDGDGLRQALQWGGASCNKPCFRHWNVVRPGCPLSHVEGYVSTHCADHSCFKLLSEEDLASVVDVAVEAWQQGQRGEMSAAQVEDTHRALGFKATAGGLLADPQLRSLVKWTQVVRYDWAHTFLADSIVGKALWSLIEAAEQNGIFTQRDIFEFLNESWMFPP